MNAVAINSIQTCCKLFNTTFFNFKVKKQLLLFLTFMFFTTASVFSQVFCEDQPGRDCDDCPTYSITPNPDLTVSCEQPIDVILIIDESNSIGNSNAEDDVELGVETFLQELSCTPVRVAIIEFGSRANYVVNTYTPVANVQAGMENYFDGISYNGQTYDPDQGNLGGTNWQAALIRANALPPADLVLMFTDGVPTAYSPDATLTDPMSDYSFCNSGSSTQEAEIYNAVTVANVLKSEGSHMFILGVGNIDAGLMNDLSDDDQYGPTETIATADYYVDPNFATLADCFASLANSICPIPATVIGSTICEDETSGTATVNILNGVGPFEVSGAGFTNFTTPLFTFDITGLAPGNYGVTILDTGNPSCFNTGTFPVEIVGTPKTVPTFDPVAAICEGAGLSPLPTESNNGINGSWSPALDNTQTTIYTFTPDSGQCATTAQITIEVTEQPEEPVTECWETATLNFDTCQWEVTGQQPEEPETACYETATFDDNLCQWVITGEQPAEPATECYETATFNTQTCEWEVTGEQPQEPTTECYETATFNTQTCEWEITGEQPQEPTTECYETATFNTQTCEWDVTGEQPQEPATECYETATFNTQTCEWEITGEQPQEPTTECYETATFNTQTCEWDVTGEQPEEPVTECYETATFNTQTCEWEITGEQPEEPVTECYETATFNTQTCEWEVTGEQPQEPTTECYETATFNTQTCEWDVTGEQPEEPTTECYETATFNTQTCEWDVTGEQPEEPATECYETATFNTQTCEWEITGEQPQEPTTECYETATFNTQTCEWDVTGEQPAEPVTECYETATFNTQTCEWEITGEQPEEPVTECYETATFNTQTCEWEVTGEQPEEPVTECYETATFNTQTCEWDVTGEQPEEPATECYETATFDTQICRWVVTGEQPAEPVTECYETATFNTQTCEWEVTGEQPAEPVTECYETAIFNTQTCEWEVTGEQPAEPATECYETATFNTQTCEWDVTGEQPEEPATECYETATFNTQTCEWDVTGEQPEEPATECYETATFNTQTCEWDVTGEQPEEPVTECYETATFNTQTCEWEITGEQPQEPATECYETATFNTQTCEWDITGVAPMITALEPTCDEDFGTYSVIVEVNLGSVTSTLGNPVDNLDGTWTILDIPVDNEVTITTSLDDDCFSSIKVESPNCVCIELDYSYSDVTCFGLDDGTIIVNSVTEGATVTVNGELYDENSVYEPGEYTIRAFFEGNDDERCIIEEVINIIEPVFVNIEVSSTDATCYGAEDGTITIESLSEGATYTIKLNGLGPDLSNQEFFAAGTYVVEATLISSGASSRKGVSAGKYEKSSRSINPCVDAKLVVIGQPEALICRMGKSFEGDEIRCSDKINNFLTVNHMGGVGPYTYSWSMDKNAMYGLWQIESGADQQTMTYIPGLLNATFTVEITDANGCTAICDITLKSTCTKDDYYNYFFRQATFDFDIYPNPTTGKVKIKPNKMSTPNAIIELYDIIGTKVYSKTFNKVSDREIDLNLSNLASQVYYLKVITKDGTKIKKVVLDK